MSMNIVAHTELMQIAKEAGQKILAIYHQSSYAISLKQDHSPLTSADIASHTYITHALAKLYPDIPIISEESVEKYSYTERKKFKYFFLVDPLDGTKEFIKRNGEFTVNIALLHHNRPVMGVIHAPVKDVTYYAAEKKGAFKYMKNGVAIPLNGCIKKDEDHINALVSRSHRDEKTEIFLQNLRAQGKKIHTVSAGSALKFGLVAEGLADIYPRFSPSMEWDTAAGHILIHEVGKNLVIADTELPLLYNKKSLLNPGFLVR